MNYITFLASSDYRRNKTKISFINLQKLPFVKKQTTFKISIEYVKSRNKLRESSIV